MMLIMKINVKDRVQPWLFILKSETNKIKSTKKVKLSNSWVKYSLKWLWTGTCDLICCKVQKHSWVQGKLLSLKCTSTQKRF